MRETHRRSHGVSLAPILLRSLLEYSLTRTPNLIHTTCFSCCEVLTTLFKTLAISFSTMTLFTGITPLYGSSLVYASPTSLVWGWVVASFFTWFVGLAMVGICSSFPIARII
ncbi:amino-acid permease BAT1 homolog [Rosa chinensis]|nr:amino-acid permease BAT1 homolog [Rosa chinensis]